jgi:hypothetical protein
LGFVNDLSEGMSGLIFEGNVGALFKNVTHGLSNSAAKVSGNNLFLVPKTNLNEFLIYSEKCFLLFI